MICNPALVKILLNVFTFAIQLTRKHIKTFKQLTYFNYFLVTVSVNLIFILSRILSRVKFFLTLLQLLQTS